jgi:hypothetical protein
MGMIEDDEEEDYWEVPDNIDTTDFDFTWRPDVYEEEYIHQFGTQWQKTGGPRLVVAGATKIKYQDFQRARALPDMSKWKLPRMTGIDRIDFDYSWHPDDTDEMFNYVFGDQQGTAEESKIIQYTRQHGAEIKFVDKPVANVVYTPLDIIFLSNGETDEQLRYDRLCKVASRPVKWIKGINGRENALREAARQSSTKWFFLFPGKLWADENFDFDFQPIRYHDIKHYIFYAKNPLNGLEYGHQAAVCYNQRLVLETLDYGLDFTMSKAHDIIPVLSGIAQYNSDITMTWRTAFREVIKLKAEDSDESRKRLQIWLTEARGQHCEWSIIGAQDGIAYYNSVNGEHSELMKSFSWQWLDEYFTSRYSV